MKKVLGALMVVGGMSGALAGCSYGDIAAVGPDKVVIMRQDLFLFGALRKAFVCKVAEGGLTSCSANEAP